MNDRCIEKYVPIAIATLNRYEHFVRCIESLKKNPEAKETELYIAIDYPSKEKWENSNKKIIEYCEEIKGFKDVHIYRQSQNLGALYNSRFIIEKVLENHDRYLFVEDDNEFSLSALSYFNECLEKYEDDEDVIGICGSNIISSYNDKILFCDSFSIKGNIIKSPFLAYGFASWKKEHYIIDKWCLDEEVRKCGNDRNKMRKLKKLSKFHYCVYIMNIYIHMDPGFCSHGRIMVIDIMWTLYMLLFDKSVILPYYAKIRNWGFDGSGEHVGKDSVMQNPLNINLDNNFEHIIDKGGISRQTVLEEVRKVFNVKKIDVLYASIRYEIYRIMKKNY